MSRSGVPRPGTGRMPITPTVGASIAVAGLAAVWACAAAKKKKTHDENQVRQHALEDAVAVHEQMLQRRRDVDGDKHADQARETEVHGAAQLLQRRRIPPPVRQHEPEVLDRIGGERRSEVADEGLRYAGGIKQEVAGTGGAGLPARSEERRVGKGCGARARRREEER